MKTKILILLILCTAFAKAQDGIGLTLLHDGRLLVLGDDKGNAAGTANPIARVELQGTQGKVGYMVIAAEYEYADLSGGEYHRYSTGVGYTFNYMALPKTDKVYELTLLAQYGRIVRWGGGYGTFVGTAEVAYKLNDRIKLVASNNWALRNDLSYRWGKGGFRHSFAAGIKIQLTK